MTAVGVSTWLWTSPLDDDHLAELAGRVAGWGFDLIELPIEQVGDWDPARAADALAPLGLGATTCAVMTPDRDLTTGDAATIAATQAYLRAMRRRRRPRRLPGRCRPHVRPGGPRVAAGRSRASGDGRRLAEALRPVADYAGTRGVRLALEPLNRYETSLVNTVDQAVEIVDAVGSPALGICLDTFHLNIEEKDPVAATRRAGHRIAHVQACGTDRGTPGHDRFDWPGFVATLAAAGYAGPVCIESFTIDNASIARAASIWRRLAPTQDQLATDGLAFLRRAFATEATTEDRRA